MNFLTDLSKQVDKAVQKSLTKDMKQSIASGTNQLEKKLNSINSFSDVQKEVTNAFSSSKSSKNPQPTQNNAPYPMPGQNQINNQFYAPSVDLNYMPPTNQGNQGNSNTGRNTDQIAGHDPDEFGRSRLMFENDKVFKLYDPNDPRGIREYQFYEDARMYLPNVFGIIIPRYDGAKNFQEPTASKPGDYIIMENTNFYLKQFSSDGDLCMADIKIGEPVTKFDREKDKLSNKTLNNLAKDLYVAAAIPQLKDDNFQVLGIKVKEKQPENIGGEKWEKYGKSFGRQSSLLGYDYIFEKFLEAAGDKNDVNNKFYRNKMINDLLYDLTSIENFLLSQTRYQFKGSSLILSYVAQSSCLLLQKNQPLNYKLAMVRLIDFNNFEGGGPAGGLNRIDQHSLNGVRNIKTFLMKQLQY